MSAEMKKELFSKPMITVAGISMKLTIKDLQYNMLFGKSAVIIGLLPP